MEHRARLSKLDTVFLSQISTRHVGGLPGMVLTLADVGRKNVAVYGTPGLHDYMLALRNFMRRDDVRLHAGEFSVRAVGALQHGSPSDGARAGQELPCSIRLPTIVKPDLSITPIMLIAAEPGNIETKAMQDLESQVQKVLPGSLRLSERLASQLQLSTSTAPAAGGPASAQAALKSSSRSSNHEMSVTFNPLVLETIAPSSAGDGNDSASSSSSSKRGRSPSPSGSLPSPSRQQQKRQSIAPSQTAACYICTTASVPGKFHPERAVSFGIPKGKLFGILQKGESLVQVEVPAPAPEMPVAPPAAAASDATALAPSTVSATTPTPTPTPVSAGTKSKAPKEQNTNGWMSVSDAAAAGLTDRIKRTVTTLDMKDPDMPGQVIAIVSCPSAAFLECLGGGNAFDEYYFDHKTASAAVRTDDRQPPQHGTLNDNPKCVRVMYHNTPSAVATTPEYGTWMRRFGPHTQHIMLDLISAPTSSSSGNATAGGGEGAAVGESQASLPTMFFDQAVQQCKMHLLRPTTFALPQPVPAAAAEHLWRSIAAAADQASASASASKPSNFVHAGTAVATSLDAMATQSPLSPLQQVAQMLLDQAAQQDAEKRAGAGWSTAATAADATSADGQSAGGVPSTDAAPVPVAPGTLPHLPPIEQHGIALYKSEVEPLLPINLHLLPNVYNATPLLIYNIVPLLSQGHDHASPLAHVDPAAAIAPVLQDPAMAPHLKQALLLAQASTDITGAAMPSHTASAVRSAALAPATQPAVPPDAEVIFTGTSSAIPNKYRNVSGIYVRMPAPFPKAQGDASMQASNSEANAASSHQRYSMFLDCGEGSFGGLVRRLGRIPSAVTASDNGGLSCVDDAIVSLRAIWISHMHADHHLGCLRLIIERAHARKRRGLEQLPLLIVGPTRMYYWLMETSRIDTDMAGNWLFVDAEHFCYIPTTKEGPKPAAAVLASGTAVNGGDAAIADAARVGSSTSVYYCDGAGDDSSTDEEGQARPQLRLGQNNIPSRKAAAADAGAAGVGAASQMIGKTNSSSGGSGGKRQRSASPLPTSSSASSSASDAGASGKGNPASRVKQRDAASPAASAADDAMAGDEADQRNDGADADDDDAPCQYGTGFAPLPRSASTNAGAGTNSTAGERQQLQPSNAAPPRRQSKAVAAILARKEAPGSGSGNPQQPMPTPISEVPSDVPDMASPCDEIPPEIMVPEAPRSSRKPAKTIIPMPTAAGDWLTPHQQRPASRSSSPTSKSTTASTTPAAFSIDHRADAEFIDAAFSDLGIVSLKAVRVRHCNKAYGLRLEMLCSRADAASAADVTSASTPLNGGSDIIVPQPWSVVYSGDTRPCHELIALGRGDVARLIQGDNAGPAPRIEWFSTAPGISSAATQEAVTAVSRGCSLLIHEATFEDTVDGRANALLKRHSTAGEASDVATAMGAQHTLLTHFSARYPKLPVIKGITAPINAAEGFEGAPMSTEQTIVAAEAAEAISSSAAAPSAHAQHAHVHAHGISAEGAAFDGGIDRMAVDDCGPGAIDGSPCDCPPTPLPTPVEAAASSGMVIDSYGYFDGTGEAAKPAGGVSSGIVAAASEKLRAAAASAASAAASSAPPAVERGVACPAATSSRTLFVAYDLMRVTGADLPHLPALLPALHDLFAVPDDDEEADGDAVV